MMNNAIILQYLSELEKNNDRAWYHANKDMLRSATEQFGVSIGTVLIDLFHPKKSARTVPVDSRLTHA